MNAEAPPAEGTSEERGEGVDMGGAEGGITGAVWSWPARESLMISLKGR